MSKSRIQVGDIYKWDNDENYTVLAIDKEHATVQFDSGIRFDYRKDYIKQNKYIDKYNMTAEIRQKFEVKHIENTILWETKRIVTAQKKIAELNEKLEIAKKKFDDYEDTCTSCLASSMILPKCSKCLHYKEAINESIKVKHEDNKIISA